MARNTGTVGRKLTLTNSMLEAYMSTSATQYVLFFVNRNGLREQVRLTGVAGTRVDAKQLDSTGTWVSFWPATFSGGFSFTAQPLSFGYFIISI